MFVSDQLIECRIRDIRKELETPKQPHDPGILRRLLRGFNRMMDSWFDGTTGDQDIEDAKKLIKSIKKIQDAASPEHAEVWAVVLGMIRRASRTGN